MVIFITQRLLYFLQSHRFIGFFPGFLHMLRKSKFTGFF